MTSKAFGLAQLGNAYSDGALSSRNKIINGSMTIDQRNAGAAVTASGAFPVDRFLQAFSGGEVAISSQQDSSAPTGFVNSTKITITTAEVSVGADDRVAFQHRIEGTNVADLAWGTANAKTTTLSFWVRSSVTGNFGGVVRNSANDRSYPFTYAILVADTWEYKTVTIAGDTSGTWLTTTGTGLVVNFSLMAGTNFVGTAGVWAAAGVQGATGQVQLATTLNATWYITGVQLEVGDTATPFEHRSYGQELALCQRYYEEVWCQWATVWNAGMNNHSNSFRATKRAVPTFVSYADTTAYAKNGATGNVRNQTNSVNIAINSVTADNSVNGFAIDYGTGGEGARNMRATITASAEL